MNNIDLQKTYLHTKVASCEIKQDNQSEQLEDIIDESEKIKEFADCFSSNIEAATRQKLIFIQNIIHEKNPAYGRQSIS